MPRSRYPRSSTQGAEGANTARGGVVATPTPKSVSDDRPTTPPPFDVEAFALQSITMDSERPPKLEPIAQGPPQGASDIDREEILGRASVAIGGPSLWAATTTRPVTLSTGPVRLPVSSGVSRTSMALGGIAVLSLVVLGSASVIGRARTH